MYPTISLTSSGPDESSVTESEELEFMEHALETFWRACYRATVRADNLAQGTDAFPLFAQLSPGIEFVSSAVRRAKRPRPDSTDELTQRTDEIIEIVDIDTNQSTSGRAAHACAADPGDVEVIENPERPTQKLVYEVQIFSAELTRPLRLQNIPDCTWVRNRYTFDQNTFAPGRDRMELRDFRLLDMLNTRDGQFHYYGQYRFGKTVDNAQGNLALVESVTCPICYLDVSVSKPNVKPLTLGLPSNERSYGIRVPSCGHWLCSECLENCTTFHQRRCPSCRSKLLPAFKVKSTVVVEEL